MSNPKRHYFNVVVKSLGYKFQVCGGHYRFPNFISGLEIKSDIKSVINLVPNNSRIAFAKGICTYLILLEALGKGPMTRMFEVGMDGSCVLAGLPDNVIVIRVHVSQYQ